VRIRPIVWLARCDTGHSVTVDSYAVGFARPDRWSIGQPAEHTNPWHAVEEHRPRAELDGEVELAACGAIVQVRGSQKWERVGAGRSACPDCLRITAPSRALTTAR
jgi:hypothetical protein